MANYPTITPYLRKDKVRIKDKKHPVYLRVRLGGRELKLSTALHIAAEKWSDGKGKRARGPVEQVIKMRLEQKVTKLENQCHSAIINGQKLTLAMIEDFFREKKKVNPEDTSIYQYIKHYIERRHNELVNGTLLGYTAFNNILRRFKENVLISDINKEFLWDFDHFLREQGYSDGGVKDAMSKFRAIINDIERSEIPINNVFRKGQYKLPQSKAKEVYLTFQELEVIENLKLPTESKGDMTREKIRVMYLFSCLSGLRFSDAIKLRWEELNPEKKMIVTTMRKTKNTVFTLFHDRARKAIVVMAAREHRRKGKPFNGKENFESNKPIFGKISNTYANKLLSEIMTFAKINKHVTFHSSRHTFATLLAEKGEKIEDISRLLGHSSIQTTMRYLQYDLGIAEKTLQKITAFD